MSNNQIRPTIISVSEYIVTDASAPFDDPNADVILRSFDNVDFRVIRFLLSYGSDFLKDLFALPQATGDGGNDVKDGLPVIRVTEERRTLEVLLLMCYPMGTIDPPVLKELEEINALLDAAIKYNVGGVERRARRMLLGPQFLAEDPLRVFAIACRYGLEEDARVAARAALSQSVLLRPHGPELDFITAGKLCQLLRYHMECLAAARNAVVNQSWLDGLSHYQCPFCGVRFSQNIALISSSWDKMQSNGIFLNEDRVKDLVETTWRQILNCNNCGVHGWTYTREFSKVMWETIDVAISSVSLNIEFLSRCTAKQAGALC